MINSAYTAFNGIKVSQTQVEVAMNNIANETTPGYKKRVVVSEEIGQMGTPQGHGSKVGEIIRVLDNNISSQLLKSTGKFNYIDTQRAFLEPIDELSRGGSSEDVLKELRDSVVNLQNTPENATLRGELKGKVQMFAYSTNNFMDAIDQANINAINGSKESVDEINMLSKKIARINESIGINENPPLDLLDKRDSYEQELAKYVKFTSETINGEYSLILDGADTNLISGRRYQELGIETNTVEQTYTSPLFSKQYLDDEGNPTDTNTSVLNPRYDSEYVGYKYNIEVAQLKIGVVDGEVSAAVDLNLSETKKGKLLAQLEYAKEGSDLENGKLMMISFLANLRDDIASKQNSDGESMKIFSIDFQKGTNDGNTSGQYITTGTDDEFDKTDQMMVDSMVDDVFADDQKSQSIYGVNESMSLKEQENFIRSTLHSMYYTKDEMSSVENSMVDMYQMQYDKVSKVDPSQEMIDVMRFQASYQAGAKMVQAVDEMIQTLLGMKR